MFQIQKKYLSTFNFKRMWNILYIAQFLLRRNSPNKKITHFKVNTHDSNRRPILIDVRAKGTTSLMSLHKDENYSIRYRLLKGLVL